MLLNSLPRFYGISCPLYRSAWCSLNFDPTWRAIILWKRFIAMFYSPSSKMKSLISQHFSVQIECEFHCKAISWCYLEDVAASGERLDKESFTRESQKVVTEPWMESAERERINAGEEKKRVFKRAKLRKDHSQSALKHDVEAKYCELWRTNYDHDFAHHIIATSSGDLFTSRSVVEDRSIY